MLRILSDRSEDQIRLEAEIQRIEEEDRMKVEHKENEVKIFGQRKSNHFNYLI